MIAHTPGPWSVPHFAEPESGCECGYVLTDGYAGAVCTVHCSGEGGVVETGDNPKFEEAKANARLIAASPDLLAANAELLKLIRRAQDRLTDYLCPEGSDDADECVNDMLEMFDGPEQRRIEAMARAANAKATGDA